MAHRGRSRPCCLPTVRGCGPVSSARPHCAGRHWLTSEAAEYPSGMCEAWAESWKEWLEKQPGKGGTESKTTEKKYAYKKVGKFSNKLIREEVADPAE